MTPCKKAPGICGTLRSLRVAEAAHWKKIPHYSFLNSLVTCYRSSSLQKITHHSLQNSFATHYRNSENYFFRNLRKFRTWILNTLEAWPLEITIRLASIGSGGPDSLTPGLYKNYLACKAYHTLYYSKPSWL